MKLADKILKKFHERHDNLKQVIVIQIEIYVGGRKFFPSL